jgi:hypothetical protein
VKITESFPDSRKRQRSSWDFSAFWTLNVALVLIVVACIVALSLKSYNQNANATFAVLMCFPTYLCGSRLLALIYNCQMRPVTIMSLATVIWYFTPLSFLALGVPGFTISADTETLTSGALSLLLCLLIGSPLLVLESRNDDGLASRLVAVAKRPPYVFLFTVTSIQLWLIINGTWTYGAILLGSSRDDGGQLTAILQMINLVATATMPLSGFLIARCLSERSTRLMLLAASGVSLLTGLVWHFISGRRYLAVELVLTAAFYLFGRYGSKGRRLTFSKVTRVLLLVVSVVLVAWPAYFAVRTASYSVGTSEMPNIAELLGAAADADKVQRGAGNSQVVIDRAAIIISYATVERSLGSFCLGNGLMNSVMLSLPPFLIDKSKLYSSTEALWAHHGVPFNDYANTPVLEAYADFGAAGFLIYGIVALALITGIGFLFRASPFASVLYSISVFYLLLNTEAGFTSYFVTLRNAVLLFSFVAVIDYTQRRIVRLKE